MESMICEKTVNSKCSCQSQISLPRRPIRKGCLLRKGRLKISSEDQCKALSRKFDLFSSKIKVGGVEFRVSAKCYEARE